LFDADAGGNSDSKERQKPNWNFQDLRSKIQTHPGDRTRSSPVDRIDLGPCPNIHQFPYYNKAAIAANPPAIPAPIPATFWAIPAFFVAVAAVEDVAAPVVVTEAALAEDDPVVEAADAVPEAVTPVAAEVALDAHETELGRFVTP